MNRSKFLVYEIWTGDRVIEAANAEEADALGDPRHRRRKGFEFSNWFVVPAEKLDETNPMDTWGVQLPLLEPPRETKVVTKKVKCVVYEIWTKARVIEAHDRSEALELADPNLERDVEGLGVVNWYAVPVEQQPTNKYTHTSEEAGPESRSGEPSGIVRRFVAYNIWTRSRLLQARNTEEALHAPLPKPARRDIWLANWFAVPFNVQERPAFATGSDENNTQTFVVYEIWTKSQVVEARNEVEARDMIDPRLQPGIEGLTACNWHAVQADDGWEDRKVSVGRDIGTSDAAPHGRA